MGGESILRRSKLTKDIAVKTIEEVQEEQRAVHQRHEALQQELKQLEARWNYLLGQAELLALQSKEEEE